MKPICIYVVVIYVKLCWFMSLICYIFNNVGQWWNKNLYESVDIFPSSYWLQSIETILKCAQKQKSRAPERQSARMSKNSKGLVRPVWRWRLWQTHFCHNQKNVGMKGLRSSLVQNVPPLVTCSNYQGVRDLESVLSAPESALETVNPDRSGARWRNLLNVFNSIGHVRRSPDGGMFT